MLFPGELACMHTHHTLKVCENLKMDILDFESPCGMFIAEEVITIQTINTNQKKPFHLNIYISVAVA